MVPGSHRLAKVPRTLFRELHAWTRSSPRARVGDRRSSSAHSVTTMTGRFTRGLVSISCTLPSRIPRRGNSDWNARPCECLEIKGSTHAEHVRGLRRQRVLAPPQKHATDGLRKWYVERETAGRELVGNILPLSDACCPFDYVLPTIREGAKAAC